MKTSSPDQENTQVYVKVCPQTVGLVVSDTNQKVGQITEMDCMYKYDNGFIL